ncbi:TIGR01777 family protein [Paenibacillus sp. IB182496]|uniref:TIGR01777 family protein n=1 Tax=Paenibacillus sabuli TaxID=2772509 RepID=A0A927BRD6_9BACL|nr:TIGR01777 family oxidoreductase [Paenibacillus sabuli]MBD2844300.1 TIGR01777 family protein [Paenibacillus sabuli]
MRVAVTGGSGFVGGALVSALLARGDEVWIVTRSTGHVERSDPKLHVITWEDMAAKPERLEGVQAVVNLAGESIDQRWTSESKERIVKSRTDAADRVARLVRALQRGPEVVVNASGISYYGTSETARFDESSPQRITDFLSSVVDKWEKAAEEIPVPRLVKLRVGVVLDSEGGAFPKMAMPYRLFGGGPVGSGRQWLPWIHLEDIVRLILFCIDNPAIEGPVNASAPEPVTNDRFGRAIARAMRRPHWFPVPAFLMKALFGEMSVVLLDGQHAVPRRALDAGFAFRYPDIDTAMQELVGG